MKIIAYIKSDFSTKFGLPRQSGLAETEAKVVFEKEYSNLDAFKGIEEFSHLWLIWDFSLAHKEDWSPTVRPPRLGGNKRVGVFATRSPYRPNPIGLSSVELLNVQMNNGRVELTVKGADLMNGTPIFDVKPYLPFTDSRQNATGGFADQRYDYRLKVECEEEMLSLLPPEKRAPLLSALSGDPRPSYQKDNQRVYGFSYAGLEIKFKVDDENLTLTVVSIGE